MRLAQNEAQNGKRLLDKLKQSGEDLMRTNPKSDRLQPYKAQYMRLCKLYVDAMKEHQKAKENMRKLQTESLVRRGMVVYGDSRSEAEIREVRGCFTLRLFASCNVSSRNVCCAPWRDARDANLDCYSKS